MFAYCENDPVDRMDCNGFFWELALASGVASDSIITTLAAGIAAAAPIIGWVVLGASAIIAIGFIANQMVDFAKGGKQRIKDSGLADMSDQEIADHLKEPSTPKSEKQRLQKEQKARGNRNSQKRQNNHKSKGKNGNKIEVDPYNNNTIRRCTQ